jgi:hypothetical protein
VKFFFAKVANCKDSFFPPEIAIFRQYVLAGCKNLVGFWVSFRGFFEDYIFAW